MPGLLDSQNAVLMIIDIQEKFRPILFNAEQVVEKTRQLINACNLLGVPVLVSEHYPKGLGATVPELTGLLGPEALVLEKISFGCMDDAGIDTDMASLKRKQVMVCGLEAHVCVNQTVVRLLEKGYEVHLIEDAIGARSETNYQIALRKLAQFGAVPSCVEMALFELMRTAKHPQFKAVQQLIK